MCRNVSVVFIDDQPERIKKRFAWKSEYSVNNEVIDRQHRRLLDLADKILLSADDKAAQLVHLEQLCTHTREHFRTEEQLMREYAFPGYVEHRATHDRIMDQLYALRARLKINPRLSGELEGFMVDWVLNHITSKDRVLASYLG